MSNVQRVIADTINEVQFSYKCPVCKRKHFHGSGGQLHNRIEERTSHCHLRNQHNDVEIEINDNTKRRKFKQ